jgi:hypothetical protein
MRRRLSSTVVGLLLLGALSCAPAVRPCGHQGYPQLTARTLEPPEGFESAVPVPLLPPPTRVIVTVHNPLREPARVTLYCGSDRGGRVLRDVYLGPAAEVDLAFAVRPPPWLGATRFSCEIRGVARLGGVE